MRRRMTLIVVGVVAIVGLALGGAAIANATQGDDGAKLTGSTLERASAAALNATGGGKVNETEYDSEKGATYEVEVRKPDGSQVDVRLDGSFKVIAIDGDHDKGADADESGQ
jgi:uncharacterized membrane protein YkoI